MHRAWRYRLKTEPAGIRFMLDYLGKGQSAIDIGANKGAYTYWMSRLVGRTGRVFAFEPQPRFARYLERLKVSFGFEQLTVVNEALSTTAGTSQLFLPTSNPSGEATLTSPGGEGRNMEVRTSVLDDFLDRTGGRPIRFIKCDVEGYELEVFNGAIRMLDSDRPHLLFECQDYRNGGGQTRRVFAFLKDLGYEGFLLKDRQRLPISEFEPAVHQASRDVPYLDNFAFLPR